MVSRYAVVLAPFALCACASIDGAPANCPVGLQRMLDAELFFGRNIQESGEVTDTDWQGFLDAEVTPRFPDGFSVEDVSGQWRSDTGMIVRERSKKLTLVRNGNADDQAKLSAVRDAYKRRFTQDSVLLVETSVCAGF